MPRSNPQPSVVAEDDGLRQEWTPSSYQYPPLRCTCGPQVICANCRAWPLVKSWRQTPPPAPAEHQRQYVIRALRWSGIVAVDAEGIIVQRPKTMPVEWAHYCRWDALRKQLVRKYKHLRIEEVRR